MQSQNNMHKTSGVIAAMTPGEVCLLSEQIVQGYYSVMHENPDDLQYYYAHDASMIFESQTAYGRSSIHHLLQQQNLRGARVNIQQMKTLVFQNDCICIYLTGELSFAEGPFREFTRTLNIIEIDQGDLFISVDMFQFLDA